MGKSKLSRKGTTKKNEKTVSRRVQYKRDISDDSQQKNELRKRILNRPERKGITGITKRWATNTLLVTALILFVIVKAFAKFAFFCFPPFRPAPLAWRWVHQRGSQSSRGRCRGRWRRRCLLCGSRIPAPWPPRPWRRCPVRCLASLHGRRRWPSAPDHRAEPWCSRRKTPSAPRRDDR